MAFLNKFGKDLGKEQPLVEEEVLSNKSKVSKGSKGSKRSAKGSQ